MTTNHSGGTERKQVSSVTSERKCVPRGHTKGRETPHLFPPTQLVVHALERDEEERAERPCHAELGKLPDVSSDVIQVRQPGFLLGRPVSLLSLALLQELSDLARHTRMILVSARRCDHKASALVWGRLRSLQVPLQDDNDVTQLGWCQVPGNGAYLRHRPQPRDRKRDNATGIAEIWICSAEQLTEQMASVHTPVVAEQSESSCFCEGRVGVEHHGSDPPHALHCRGRQAFPPKVRIAIRRKARIRQDE